VATTPRVWLDAEVSRCGESVLLAAAASLDEGAAAMPDDEELDEPAIVMPIPAAPRRQRPAPTTIPTAVRPRLRLLRGGRGAAGTIPGDHSIGGPNGSAGGYQSLPAGASAGGVHLGLVNDASVESGSPTLAGLPTASRTWCSQPNRARALLQVCLRRNGRVLEWRPANPRSVKRAFR